MWIHTIRLVGDLVRRVLCVLVAQEVPEFCKFNIICETDLPEKQLSISLRFSFNPDSIVLGSVHEFNCESIRSMVVASPSDSNS